MVGRTTCDVKQTWPNIAQHRQQQLMHRLKPLATPNCEARGIGLARIACRPRSTRIKNAENLTRQRWQVDWNRHSG
jgi:hypothetical protein